MTSDDNSPFSGPWETLLRTESRQTIERLITDRRLREVCRLVTMTVTELVVVNCDLFPWAAGKEMRIVHIASEARTRQGKDITQVTYAPAGVEDALKLAYLKMVSALSAELPRQSGATWNTQQAVWPPR